MSNITRNSQVQAARQRLASRQVPGGATAGNVAGCGAGPVPVAPTLPGGCGVPAEYDARFNGSVVSQSIAPLGIISENPVTPEGVTLEISCPGSGLFYASGISSCNDCFEIIMSSLTVGGLNTNLLCGDVDVGVWNTVDCYCPLDIGCISNISPATITVRAFGTPSVAPTLNMALWGCLTRGIFDCGYQLGGVPVPGPWYPGPGGAGGGRAPGGIYDRYTLPGGGGNGGMAG